ncbi:MAG: hypothetical protein QM754_03305 [Tepidisphaeraceae bacterium]
MSSSTHETSHTLHINETRDGDRSVVFHPENDDLFVQTGKQVIEACRLNISVELWQHEVTAMFERVREWAAERDNRIDGCYATARPTKLVVFVTPVSSTYDFDLADEITSLNRELLRNYNVGYVELAQVPRGQMDRFVHPQQVRPIYAKPG